MVGLPARGKTYLAKKIQRYLRWLGIDTEIFNVGCQRQKLANRIDHTFFDFHNANGMSQREQAAETTLTAMLDWFDQEKGTVAIYDGSNCTRARRAWIHEKLASRGIEVLFIESICQDESIIQSNIQDIISKNPDYQDMDPIVAEADFKQRIKHYEEMYETITEDHLTYLKIIDANQQCIINHVRGYLESRIVYFLMNVKIRPKSIWFSRHGESQFNVQDKIGGDADLSPRGQMYANRLPDLIKEHVGDRPLTVWTSSMKRTIQTAHHLHYTKKSWKALDELNTGVCDGMTYAEIEEKYPEDFARRDEDKFNYRYRGGESYRDLVLRVEPIIMELERHDNILLVAHQATLRCIFAYFLDVGHDELPYIKVPLHTLIELIPNAHDCEQQYYRGNIEAVDTFRPKGDRVTKLKDTDTSNAGAIGEIADAKNPILPLSPKLYPKRESIH
ncbi:bifunctional 6-phosphofructo-2-kinase/fructose-2,6-bisphosphate 2-phosphatase [Lichtheimia hyalospora FSU 10163]|nr:bifunctional 6-phosphofructo-2-kinase/fructose-2,6-bisphosphate 2-phosphatase [Lichtheimia hyalospora FSU 10163]